MTKVFRCRDIGFECSFVAQAEAEEELMESVAQHGRTEHGIETISPELRERIRGAIRQDTGMERHEPPHTTTGPLTAPKFGSAGSGGAEYEPIPEQHDED
jgi:predicted small metal-binding protein